jgi:hypothetical protein
MPSKHTCAWQPYRISSVSWGFHASPEWRGALRNAAGCPAERQILRRVSKRNRIFDFFGNSCRRIGVAELVGIESTAAVGVAREQPRLVQSSNAPPVHRRRSADLTCAAESNKRGRSGQIAEADSTIRIVRSWNAAAMGLSRDRQRTCAIQRRHSGYADCQIVAGNDNPR